MVEGIVGFNELEGAETGSHFFAGEVKGSRFARELTSLGSRGDRRR
jgi:hypothetical protein